MITNFKRLFGQLFKEIRNENKLVLFGSLDCMREASTKTYYKDLEKNRIVAKENNKKHKQRNRNTAFKRRFGITLKDYYRMFKKQKGKCAGCLKSQSEFNKAFAVDHDHSCCPPRKSCGKCIRGLLCVTCNWLLGAAKDDPKLLIRLAKYLKKNQGEL